MRSRIVAIDNTDSYKDMIERDQPSCSEQVMF